MTPWGASQECRQCSAYFAGLTIRQLHPAKRLRLEARVCQGAGCREATRPAEVAQPAGHRAAVNNRRRASMEAAFTDFDITLRDGRRVRVRAMSGSDVAEILQAF